MAYLQARALQEAFDALDNADATPVAGGTDWFPAQGERLTGRTLVDIGALPGFRGVERMEDGWRIGAATRWTDIVRADLPPAFDGLKAAAREVGSIQIQNAGTVGGNICNASPAADGVPPLLTLDASVELVSRNGRRSMPLSDFITGVRRTALLPSELVSGILIPPTPQSMRSSFVKAGARRYLVISIAMVAAAVELRDGRIAQARVAVGACSPVAQRLPALEAALAGRTPDDLPGIAAEHLAPLSPISDVRGSAEYRLEAAAEMIRRAIGAALAGTMTT